jgi:formate dehydrogenase major subunit
MTSTKTHGDQPFWTRAQQLEKRPPCQAECPNSGNVRGWLGIIAQREKHGLSLEKAYDRAWEELAQRNPFPGTIGRICPHPCETRCTREGKDGAVSINAMERFLGDWGVARKLPLPRLSDTAYPESIGVVGSGPAGLSFAYQMARRGYPVTLYEKNAEPGGMLRHAIPDYRLPRALLDAEIERILAMPVTLHKEVEPGVDISLEDLRDRHSLLFLGMGAQGARLLGIPGEVGDGVLPGIDYLIRRKQGITSPLGDAVVVVGGGNTAIDAARSARRDGADVTVLYRRTRQEMPASVHEIDDAIAEGVKFRFLVAPTAVIRDDTRVTGAQLQRMQLGAPDERGRRRPIPIDGALEQIDADTILIAVSQQPAWHGLGDTSWLLTEEDGRLADDLWAGGDDTGPGIASRAIAQGRLAAEAAHAQLRGEARAPMARATIETRKVKVGHYDSAERGNLPRRPAEEWLQHPDEEIDQTISSEQALHEAARCMSCGLCFDCHQCVMYCNARGFSTLPDASPGHYYYLNLEACEGCGKCVELCPCGYLDAREGSPWGRD